MSYVTGTASTPQALFDALVRFVTGYGTAGTPAYSGTGNGTISGVDTSITTITETWTIACTAAATNGGTFSVVGSVSGAQASATVGTPYDNGKIKFTINDGTADFIVGDQFTIATTQSPLTAAGQHWEQLRRNSYSADAKRDFVDLRGKGLAGTDNIYIQLALYKDAAADTYSIRVSGSQGWLSSVSITQPELQANSSITGGAQWSGNHLVLRAPLYNNPMSYWFIASGRRIILVAKVGSYWASLYAGFFLPYGSPAQYPYPLFVGANSAADDKYSNTAANVAQSSFYAGVRNTAAYMRPDGVWYPCNALTTDNGTFPWGTGYGAVWPWTRSANGTANASSMYAMNYMQTAPDGTYPMLPAIVFGQTGNLKTAVYLVGELDGVFATTGFGAAAGDTITAGSDNYLMIQRASLNAASDFAALHLG